MCCERRNRAIVNAFLITSIFFTVARARPSLRTRPMAIGAAYGLVVYLVMNFVVIPLSRIGMIPHPPVVLWATEVPVHMFLIGVPIALAARRAFGTAEI